MMHKGSLTVNVSQKRTMTSEKVKILSVAIMVLTSMMVADLDVVRVGAFTPVHGSGGSAAAPAAFSNNNKSKPQSPNSKTGPRSKVVGSFTLVDETSAELMSPSSKPTPAGLQVAILTSPTLRRTIDQTSTLREKVSFTGQRRKTTVNPKKIVSSQAGTPPRLVNDLPSPPTTTSRVVATTKRNLKTNMVRPKSHTRNIISPRQQQQEHSRRKIDRSIYYTHYPSEDNDYDDDEEEDDVGFSMDDRLLSRDEERDIVHRIRHLRVAVRIRDELVQTSANIPTEQQWAEACSLSVLKLRRVMHDGQQARTVLVSSNVGLVTSIAKRHYYALKQATGSGGGVGTILTLQDMIQEGNLGLMKAAERFEPERGFKFSTYATYWIRQRILQSISDCSRVIRLPAHVYAMVQKVYKARKEMAMEIGRVPSDPELAHFMQISVEELRRITSKAQDVLSLESPVRRGGSHKSDVDLRTLGDSIASDAPTPEEDAQQQYLQHDIRIVINQLAEHERDVLVLRFGLENGEPLSTSQTAIQLGITTDRVRLVEARALNKLRSPQRNYRLKEYVGGHVEEDEHLVTSPYQSHNIDINNYQNQPQNFHQGANEKLWFF